MARACVWVVAPENESLRSLGSSSRTDLANLLESISDHLETCLSVQRILSVLADGDHVIRLSVLVEKIEHLRRLLQVSP